MTTYLLDLPPIDTIDAAAVAVVQPSASGTLDLAKVDLTDAALAQFGNWKADAAKVRRLAEQQAEAAPGCALLDARQKELDAQAAEIKRQADELAAQRAESERLEKLADERRAVILAAQKMPDLPTERVGEVLRAMAAPDYAALEADLGDPPSYEGEPRDQTDAEIEAANGPEVDLPPEPATLNLGAICEWLGFTVSASFLASIGVERAERRKMAHLYRESQRAEIKGALMEHLAGL